MGLSNVDFLIATASWGLNAPLEEVCQVWAVGPPFLVERTRLGEKTLSRAGDEYLEVAEGLLNVLPNLETAHALDHILAVVLISIRLGLAQPQSLATALRILGSPPLVQAQGLDVLSAVLGAPLEEVLALVRSST